MFDNHGIDAHADLFVGRRPHTMTARDAEVPEYFAQKVVWMRLFGAMLLALFSPIMLLIMLIVRLTSPGPALFRQTRLGRDGNEFSILKIRTMYRDAEAVSGPTLCQPGDSRMTPVGRVLRFLHLDELPQLINVVRGEMCLVGPRPERPEIIARNRLREKVPGFAERTKVLPGVTGLAQINLPADVDAASVIPKVQLDLEYIELGTAGLDLRILTCTALHMMGVRHGRAVKLLGLGRPISVNREAQLAADNWLIEADAQGKAFRHSPRQRKFAAADFARRSSNGNHDVYIPASVTIASDVHQDGAEAAMEQSPAVAFSPHRPR